MIDMLTWILDVFRLIMGFIDKIVYFFITLLISLFNSLARVEIFNGSIDFVSMIANRIYILVSIIMVFKVSFSIIQYIINPDSFSDKERGMGKTIQAVLIVLVSLVAVRYVFNVAYDLQRRVLESNVIEKIILGIDVDLDSERQKNISKSIPYTLLSAFISPNNSKIADFGFNQNGVYTCSGKEMVLDSQSEIEKPIGSSGDAFANCIDGLSKEGSRNFRIDGIEYTKDTGGAYMLANQTYNTDLLIDLINDKYTKNQEIYIFDYKFIISTVAGIFALIMYANFCIDLAIRTVKFAFLQLIAPIPIISMIDPKSSKGGMMSKWVKNCFSTYIGLFIRIAAVSFAVLVVSIVTNPTINEGMNVHGNWILGVFTKVFVIFGALLFAKELPKLISDLTGFDLSGNFKLNPLSRVPGGKAATNLVKGVGLAAGSMIGAGASIAGRAAVSTLATPGQALFHKINPNLFPSVGQMWRGAGNSMMNRLQNNGSNALNHLRSGLPKFVQGNNGGTKNNNSNQNNYRDNMNLIKQGEELSKIVDDNNGDLTSIFQSTEFAENVAEMQKAKSEMIAANSRLEEIKARANSGDSRAQAMLGDAIGRAKKASDYYDERKKYVDTLGQHHKRDYQKLKAYKAYNDLNSGASNSRVMTEPFTGYEVATNNPNNSNNEMPSVNAPNRNVSGGNRNNNPSTPFDPSNMDG